MIPKLFATLKVMELTATWVYDPDHSGMTFLGIAAPICNVATEFSKTPPRSLRRLRFDFFEEIGLGVMPPVRMVAVPSSLILI